MTRSPTSGGPGPARLLVDSAGERVGEGARLSDGVATSPARDCLRAALTAVSAATTLCFRASRLQRENTPWLAGQLKYTCHSRWILYKEVLIAQRLENQIRYKSNQYVRLCTSTHLSTNRAVVFALWLVQLHPRPLARGELGLADIADGARLGPAYPHPVSDC